ncbi:MAG: fibronectin type III domain-containing protein [Luteolibacter sp.]
MMANVALNLRNLSVSEKIGLARRIFSAMDGNALFPSPDPPLVLLARLTQELEAQNDALSQAKNEALLGDTLSRLATYVQRVSGGSESAITAAGMGVDSSHANNGAMSKPVNFSVTQSTTAGEMTLRCDPVPGAKTYVFQSTADPLANDSVWIIGSVSTGHIGTITCIEAGQRNWFRVSAVGPDGQGPWSDPVSEMCH